MSEKTVRLKTNYNNKLGSHVFVHVDLAPEKPIPESVVSSTIFVIETLDNSFPAFKAQMINLCRFELRDAYNCFTMPSHGMDSEEFKIWLLQEKPKLSDESQMAAYFYKKIGDGSLATNTA